MKMWTLWVMSGLPTAALLACAAGSKEEPAAPHPTPPAADAGVDAAPTPPADVNAFCAARATAECSGAVMSHCGVQDRSTCISKGTAACLAAVPQGTTYQPSKAFACLGAVTNAYATGQITAMDEAAIDQACGPALFSGPGAARSPCTGPYDCASAQGLTCIIPFPPPADGTGKCLVPNDVTPGGGCSGEADVCADGYYCAPQSKQCLAASQAGQSCSPGYQPCAAGLTCPGSGLFGATCKALGADGTPCQAASDCASDLCDKATGQGQGNCASVIMLTSLDSMCSPFQ